MGDSKMAMIPTIQDLQEQNRDLGSRLALCSNSGEGRKVRKEIEALIKKNNQQIYKIEALCIHQ